MRVLIVSAFKDRGGASIAAKRLFISLKKEIDCQMLVQDINVEYLMLSCNEHPLIRLVNFITNHLEVLYLRLLNKPKHNFSFSFFGSLRIVKMINNFNADIVNLHWVCNNTLSISDIKKIKAPIVWTLHDNWPFSDGTHTISPIKKNTTYVYPDINKNDSWFLHKKRLFDLKNNLYVVGPSRWIASKSKSSLIMKDRKHFHIPNPINVDEFRPLSECNFKKKFNIDENSKLILFGANNPFTDANKGFSLLMQALDKIKTPNSRLVIYGAENIIPNKLKAYLADSIVFNKISNNNFLNQIYNSSDVIVVPSLHENFSNTILESFSSGKPVVAYNVGGNAELIEHKVNGYLAIPFDTGDFARGIDWIFDNQKKIDFQDLTRTKVKDLYSNKVISKKYIELFDQILSNNSK